ncbi:hypothetical protein HZS_1785 [Henneguya salminicola]|nr:hypothetical protein HZS_1785 [Henneguya salminicola]
MPKYIFKQSQFTHINLFYVSYDRCILETKRARALVIQKQSRKRVKVSFFPLSGNANDPRSHLDTANLGMGLFFDKKMRSDRLWLVRYPGLNGLTLHSNY